MKRFKFMKLLLDDSQDDQDDTIGHQILNVVIQAIALFGLLIAVTVIIFCF